MPTTTTISSREFNQDTGSAKRASATGPVFITDRGEPSYVLLNITEYRLITGAKYSLAEALYMPEAADIEIEFPRSRELAKPFDFD